MSGLWRSVADEHTNKGIAIGEARGEARGITIGRQEERNDLLTQMIANGDLTAAQAAKYQAAY